MCPKGIPEHTCSVFSYLYHQYDEHAKKSKDYEKLSLSKAKSMLWLIYDDKYIPSDEFTTLFTSISKYRYITVLVWLCEIVTPTRFRHPKQIAAYCGCDPFLKVSAGKVTFSYKKKR